MNRTPGPPEALSRRKFLKRSLSLAAGLGVLALPQSRARAAERAGDARRDGPAGGSQLSGNPRSSGSTSRGAKGSRSIVIITRKEKATPESAASYKEMLDASMRRLTGGQRIEDAWGQLFLPEDVVAIKVNAITGRRLSTSPLLVAAITDCLVSGGVKPENIVVWDRTTWELENAGFRVNFTKNGPLCFGTDAPSFGYDSYPTEIGSIGSCFSRIVTEKATALINVPVLREHSLAGVSMALKNNYGAIHNPNKYHADGCSPFVADVNCHPAIRTKTRLCIGDAMRVQFHSGPGYKPEWISDFRGIVVSKDPVALDTIGTEELEELRKAAGLKTLREQGRSPAYLEAAERRGLGVSDRSRIDVINMEVA